MAKVRPRYLGAMRMDFFGGRRWIDRPRTLVSRVRTNGGSDLSGSYPIEIVGQALPLQHLVDVMLRVCPTESSGDSKLTLNARLEGTTRSGVDSDGYDLVPDLDATWSTITGTSYGGTSSFPLFHRVNPGDLQDDIHFGRLVLEVTSYSGTQASFGVLGEIWANAFRWSRGNQINQQGIIDLKVTDTRINLSEVRENLLGV